MCEYHCSLKAAFVFLLVFFLLPQHASAGLLSPYPDLSFSAFPVDEGLGENFTCKKPSSPVRDLFFESIYEDDDETRSRVSEEKKIAYKRAMSPLSNYGNYVTSLANASVAQGGSNQEIAKCVSKWLDKWAKNDAMMGETNRVGKLVRKWVLASVASAYAQVKGSPALDPKRKSRIEAWLRRLGYEVVSDFSRKTEDPSKQNNHLYWAAWAVAITAYDIQDPQLFSWAVDRARFGISQIQADGTLPLEMARGGRALLYHVFAAAPLVMIAEMAARNDIDLYAQDKGALHRLVERSLEGLKNPSWFEEKTGEPQDYKDIKDANGLAWLAVYDHRFSSPKVREAMKSIAHEPLLNSRLGGDTEILFGQR